MNHQIRLTSRPSGMPTADNFEAADAPIPSPKDGEVLRRTLYSSLDPYMRGRMSDAPSYAPPVNLGEVMCGHTVSEVVESRHPAFSRGDVVAGYDGWQQYARRTGQGSAQARRRRRAAINRDRRPRHARVYCLCRPLRHRSAEGGRDRRRIRRLRRRRIDRRSTREDSRLPCSRRRRLAREVPTTSSTLGFDACVNYKSDDLARALAAACPSGVDVYFENVGGAVFAAVLKILNRGARIPLCGLISEYNATENPAGRTCGRCSSIAR